MTKDEALAILANRKIIEGKGAKRRIKKHKKPERTKINSNLFNTYLKNETLTTLELEIRNKYLQELKDTTSCNACIKSTLKRKYINILKERLAERT